MSVQGHAARICTPMPGTVPIRWKVTTWCGRELEDVQVLHGAYTSPAVCGECQEGQAKAEAAKVA